MRNETRPVSYPKRRTAPKPPRPRAQIYLATIGAAAFAATALVIASQFGSAGTSTPSAASASVLGAVDTTALLDGIPQRGAALGSAKAPVTLVEYADLQCPYCGEFARNTLPSLIRDYVRTGKVRLVFRGLAFVGPESETALRAALAAGRQDRLWTVVDLLYANQGAENSGWVTDRFVRSVARAAGADVARLTADAEAPATTDAIAAAQQHATNDGVSSTPSFFVGRTGGTLTRLEVRSLEPAAFRPTLERLLGR